MIDNFVNYEIALKLKQLEFDEDCCGYFSKNKKLYECNFTNIIAYDVIKAPLKQQVFKWFREKHNLFGCIDLQVCNPAHWYIRVDNITKNDYLYHSEDENLKFETYELAEESCLLQLIKLIENV